MRKADRLLGPLVPDFPDPALELYPGGLSLESPVSDGHDHSFVLVGEQVEYVEVRRARFGCECGGEETLVIPAKLPDGVTDEAVEQALRIIRSALGGRIYQAEEGTSELSLVG